MDKARLALPPLERCAEAAMPGGQPRMCMKCGLRQACRVSINSKGGKQYRCESCSNKKNRKVLK